MLHEKFNDISNKKMSTPLKYSPKYHFLSANGGRLVVNENCNLQITHETIYLRLKSDLKNSV